MNPEFRTFPRISSKARTIQIHNVDVIDTAAGFQKHL